MDETAISNLPSLTFTSEIPDIVFGGSGTYNKIRITLYIDYIAIYDETLTPDSQGNVTLRDAANLIEPYARQQLRVTVQFSMQCMQDDDVVSKGVGYKDFAYCRAITGLDSAEAFAKGYFLSTFMGTRRTAIGRLEYLHYLRTDTDRTTTDDTTTITATAYYTDQTTATFTPEKTQSNSIYTTIDVSPDNFATTGKTLYKVEIRAGERLQVYQVEEEAEDCAPILLFTNSFGCQEIAYCTGLHEVDPEYDRQTTYFGRRMKAYRVQETRKFLADTGVMTRAEADWMDELLRSQEIYVLNIYNGVPTVGEEVVITESESKHDNAHDTLPRFTFTYQYARRNHNIMQLKRAGRIFDNTFDNTFN